MAWKHDERLDVRGYTDPNERKAFGAGYSDGYYGYHQWASNERDWHPNAYSAGYWEGYDDGKCATCGAPPRTGHRLEACVL